MAIALTLQQYLDDQHIDYDVMVHERTATASHTAEASHVSADCVAKGVVLSREGGFLIAVVPASCTVRLEAIRDLVQSPVSVSSADEIDVLFPDCESGAVPALGEPYGIEAIVDDSLDERADIYFEGGDHRTLIHMSGQQFRDLLHDVPHGQIAKHR